MAGRRKPAAEALVEGAVENTAPSVEAEQPAEDVPVEEVEATAVVEADEPDADEPAEADEAEVPEPEAEPEADAGATDEGAERTAVAHVAFMDGHELVRFAPGDTIPSKYADRVTSAKAVAE